MRVRGFRAGVIAVAAFGLAATAAADSANQGNQGQIGAVVNPNMDSAQQLAQAQGIQARGSSLAERLSKMLSEARRDKDILRVNCLNRKLTEVNATSATVGQRLRDLSDAANAGDDGRRNHEFTVLTVLSQKLDSLDQEAAQCLGQGTYQAGGSQVTTTIPANAPVGNAAVVPPPPPPPPSVALPPPLSPAG